MKFGTDPVKKYDKSSLRVLGVARAQQVMICGITCDVWDSMSIGGSRSHGVVRCHSWLDLSQDLSASLSIRRHGAGISTRSAKDVAL
jgi:hypothetical protein